ncbi:EF-hand domain-containing protein [Streptomyces sp. NPDC096032]|uniref:EF-hand domain-containing protein n=1 Tax=Streptomyces sp. NPDC096032 TaxID=3366070 RepID=UPI0037FA80C4
MASEFQRDKLRAMFDAFDADRDGYLERQDFEALAARWCRMPRVAGEPGLAGRVESVMPGWWGHLAAAVGPGGDARIDMDGLLGVVDRLPAVRAETTATADVMFDAVDDNRDGRISRTEHRRLIDAWHGRPVDTADVFEHLDQDGDGCLSRSEFAFLWTQFWTSDDPGDPGNLMCGPLGAQEV